jgi:hypothetical protein
MAVLLVTVAVLAATSAAQAETGSAQTFTFDKTELEIRNLIGQIVISGHDGSSFEVEVTFHGEDAADGALTVLREEDGDRGQLAVQFPSDRVKYVYPRLGKNSSTSFSRNDDDRGWLAEVISDLFGGKVTVKGSGSGLEMWADVEVRVPSGATLSVRHGVGEIQATGVDGELNMELRSGPVEVDEIDGSATLSTGSGRVNAREIRGSAVIVATGSGSVELEQVETTSLTVATGSGRVSASNISTDSAQIATGSGRVHLQLLKMGQGDFDIGTGSGGVDLEVPADASIDVHAETGSGGVTMDLDGEMTLKRHDRDEVEFTMGGGDARVRIGTGSGGIRITD